MICLKESKSWRSRFTSVLSVGLALLPLPSSAHERDTIEATRNASSGLTLEDRLSLSKYQLTQREVTEEVDVPYTESEPYEAEETYYENEQVCGNRDEQVCQDRQRCEQVRRDGGQECTPVQRCERVRRDGGRDCDPVQRCERVRRDGGRSCTPVRRCQSGPRGPVCETDTVCRDNPDTWENVCHTETVCRNLPDTWDNVCHTDTVCRSRPDTWDTVCRNEPECHTESRYSCQTVAVPHTRTVTRYRDVTRYRKETRTRIVTDRTYVGEQQREVLVHFPAHSELMGEEVEQVRIHWEGELENGDVSIQIRSSVFKYEVLKKDVREDRIEITLKASALRDRAQLGESSIEGVALGAGTGGTHLVWFNDRGRFEEIQTEYGLTVVEVASGKTVVEKRDLKAENTASGRVILDTGLKLSEEKSYKVVLSVKRTGRAMGGNGVLEFQKTTQTQGRVDPAKYSDATTIQEVAVRGRNDSAELVFKDKFEDDILLRTEYVLTLKRRAWRVLWKRTVASVEIKRSALKADANGLYHVDLAKLDGVSAGELKKYFDSGDTLYLTLQVKRLTSGNSQVVGSFEVSKKVEVK